jgi:uncharacterized protein YfiM (DUF2279 family)
MMEVIAALWIGAAAAAAQPLAEPGWRPDQETAWLVSAITAPGPQAPVPVDAVPRDAWFGEDKVRHFLMSYAIVALTYGGARAVGLDREPATVGALATGAVAGVLKEVSDARRGEIFSVRDLVWDAAGLAAGLLVIQAAR